MIDQNGIEPDLANPEATGIIKNNSGLSVDYKIFVGWDIAKSYQCDKTWGMFNTKLLQFIKDQDYTEEQLNEIEAYIQLGDSHWDWLSKSCAYRTDEYRWFYIYSGDMPQAACLIYHPKKSFIHQKDIFYIEYLAVAPWNRKNPMQVRELSGLGKVIVQFAVKYAVDELGLHLGFSLHSLPAAIGFYENIGMISFTEQDKGSLKFYEMPSQIAVQYLDAS